MWGSIVGFGEYHYKYESGREGDSAAAGFAARKAATTVYAVDGIGAHTDLLERLGPHTTGVGCIYIKDLTKVDLAVLEAIISQSYTTLTAGTYTKRAREGGKD
jgi:predicted GIY-YIG superfamily endonuclease